MVERPGLAEGRVAGGEVEEFDFRRREERVAVGAGLVEISAQHLSRITGERGLVEVRDVTEHSCRGFVLLGPGK